MHYCDLAIMSEFPVPFLCEDLDDQQGRPHASSGRAERSCDGGEIQGGNVEVVMRCDDRMSESDY